MDGLFYLSLVLLTNSIPPPYRQYVFHVENKFRQAGLKVEVVFLAPRMSLESVLLQMNHEGVKAVVFVERASANNESVTMLIFDGNTGYVGESCALILP